MSLLSRQLLRSLSRIAPEECRDAWFDRWDADFASWRVLHDRGELIGSTSILSICLNCVRDAVSLRVRTESAQAIVHGPGLVLGAGVGVLLLMTVFTHAFRGARSSFAPIPIQDPAALASIQYPTRPSERTALLGRLLPLWREKSTLAQGVAGYRYAYNFPLAWVTTNFFDVLGTHPAAGRLLQSGDRNAVLLSYPAWRSTYRANPRIVGASIRLDDQIYTVVGILPELVWALSPNVDYWIPLNLETQPPRPGFRSGVVARVRAGTTPDQLAAELASIAKGSKIGSPRPVRVVPLTILIPGGGIYLYLLGTIFSLISGLVLVVREHRQTGGHGWRYWAFLAAKTVLAVAIPLLAWMESGAFFRTFRPILGAGAFIGQVVSLFVFLLACSGALWWSFADQRRRCPACLRQLAMPVTVGSPASVFEPALTELICPNGHGALSLPEDETDRPDRWVVLDSSWGELFRNKST